MPDWILQADVPAPRVIDDSPTEAGEPGGEVLRQLVVYGPLHRYRIRDRHWVEPRAVMAPPPAFQEVAHLPFDGQPADVTFELHAVGDTLSLDVDCHDALAHQEGRQRYVLGNDEVPRLRVRGNVRVSNIQALSYAHG